MDPNAPSPEQAYQDEIRFRAKRELRKRMRALRAAMPPGAVRERSEAIARRVLEHPAWASAKSVGLFMSMPDEVQTDGLVSAARAAGKIVALPVVTEAAELTFRAPWADGVERSLVQSAFGIMEPGEDSPVVPADALDFVLVPALAADERGHRIGYGRGYYDRTFANATRPVRAVVAFDFQLIVEVPDRPGDLRTHWIITDRRTLRAEDPPSTP